MSRQAVDSGLAAAPVLLVNLGACITLLAPRWLAWHALPGAVEPASHGWRSMALTVLGLAAIAWCVRDALSGRRLRQCRQRQQQWQRLPASAAIVPAPTAPPAAPVR